MTDTRTDSCSLVENELSRVIAKFTAVQGHSNRVLGDVTASFEGLQAALNEGNFLSNSIHCLRSENLGGSSTFHGFSDIQKKNC